MTTKDEVELVDSLRWALRQLGAHVPSQRQSERSYKNGVARARAALASATSAANPEQAEYVNGLLDARDGKTNE